MKLDATFFPHIIDEIFSSASPAALLVLRRVSKEWRQRAEAHLPFHVYVANAPQTGGRYVVQTSSTVSRWDSTTTFSANPAILVSAAVVDLDVPWLNIAVARILRFCPPQVTIRCHGYCDLSRPGPPTPSCLVLFAIEARIPESSSYWNDYREPSSYWNDYRLKEILAPMKLVIHLRDGSRFWSPPRGLGGTTSLTLILHPWRLDDCGASLLTHSVKHFLDYQLQSLISFIRRGLMHGIPVTVTGIAFSHLEECHPKVGSVKDHVMARIAEIPPHRPGQSKGWAALNYRYLTLEEYRAEVGDTQFEIEMNDGPLSRPSLRPQGQSS